MRKCFADKALKPNVRIKDESERRTPRTMTLLRNPASVLREQSAYLLLSTERIGLADRPVR